MSDIRKHLLLYGVTDRPCLKKGTLAEAVRDAVAGGATMIQLREKDLPRDAMREEAEEIAVICRAAGIPFLINDDAELASELDADGVHVGQSDMAARAARELLGPGKIVGVTAKTVEQALKAQADGADYIGSGAVFGTLTKPDAKPMELETLRMITAAVSIPVVAIGGINRGNAPGLSGTGIAGAAVVSGLFGAEDIREEARELKKIMEKVVRV